MAEFKDGAGRKWTVAVTVADVRRVRSALSVNLAGLFDEGLAPMRALLADPCKLVDVLWVLIEPQARDKCTDEEFGRSLAGDSLESAANALLEALIDFFPQRESRATFRRIHAKAKELEKVVGEQILQKLEDLDLATLLSPEGAEAGPPPASPTGSSSGPPGSAASTPAPSPSAS